MGVAHSYLFVCVSGVANFYKGCYKGMSVFGVFILKYEYGWWLYV